MTFTVRSLLDLPEARTVSLTPGVGEDRPIAWAHVCELPTPWRWLGRGALVMTTGLVLPESADAQARYFGGMFDAGIAAVAIDELLTAAPVQQAALTYAASIGFPVLQTAHEVPFVSLAMAVADAARRRGEWARGALLLGSLCGGSVPADPAAELIASYGIRPPYTAAAAQGDPEPHRLLEHLGSRLGGVPALATVSAGEVLILGHSGAPLDHALAALAGSVRVGASAGFDDLDELQTAIRQARSALIRNREPGLVMRFEEHEPTSLFLPSDPEQLHGIAQQVLGPLQTYDEQRGTELTHTLQVFLEENRSWVRAAERLYVHRQTLIARVSRIEKIIGRDLSSMEDAAECWLAVQAAIGSGMLSTEEEAPRSQLAT